MKKSNNIIAIIHGKGFKSFAVYRNTPDKVDSQAARYESSMAILCFHNQPASYSFGHNAPFHYPNQMAKAFVYSYKLETERVIKISCHEFRHPTPIEPQYHLG